MKTIVLLAILACLAGGCVNSPFGPTVTLSLYNRGGTVSTAEGNTESLVETEGGGELKVEPVKP